jgi:hypothetical protein
MPFEISDQWWVLAELKCGQRSHGDDESKLDPQLKPSLVSWSWKWQLGHANKF